MTTNWGWRWTGVSWGETPLRPAQVEMHSHRTARTALSHTHTHRQQQHLTLLQHDKHTQTQSCRVVWKQCLTDLCNWCLRPAYLDLGTWKANVRWGNLDFFSKCKKTENRCFRSFHSIRGQLLGLRVCVFGAGGAVFVLSLEGGGGVKNQLVS